MRRRLLVLTVAMMSAALMSITVGPPAWGQEIDGCTDDDNDTPCLPTTTEECKNGDWQDFITDGSGHHHTHLFKNQGDCVSFVATGGKHSPAG
jgi:hypothetical protein